MHGIAIKSKYCSVQLCHHNYSDISDIPSDRNRYSALDTLSVFHLSFLPILLYNQSITRL